MNKKFDLTLWSASTECSSHYALIDCDIEFSTSLILSDNSVLNYGNIFNSSDSFQTFDCTSLIPDDVEIIGFSWISVLSRPCYNFIPLSMVNLSRCSDNMTRVGAFPLSWSNSIRKNCFFKDCWEVLEETVAIQPDTFVFQFFGENFSSCQDCGSSSPQQKVFDKKFSNELGCEIKDVYLQIAIY